MFSCFITLARGRKKASAALSGELDGVRPPARQKTSSIGTSFVVCLAANNVGSPMDSTICQTPTVNPAEPGGFLFLVNDGDSYLDEWIFESKRFFAQTKCVQ